MLTWQTATNDVFSEALVNNCILRCLPFSISSFCKCSRQNRTY